MGFFALPATSGEFSGEAYTKQILIYNIEACIFGRSGMCSGHISDTQTTKPPQWLDT